MLYIYIHCIYIYVCVLYIYIVIYYIYILYVYIYRERECVYMHISLGIFPYSHDDFLFYLSPLPWHWPGREPPRHWWWHRHLPVIRTYGANGPTLRGMPHGISLILSWGDDIYIYPIGLRPLF